MNEVTIYTDGAAKGNPGPGGYGVVLMDNNNQKELSGGFRHTTNNRMELLAAIEGLRALNHSCKVDLYSDSTYVVYPFSKGLSHGLQEDGKRVIETGAEQRFMGKDNTTGGKTYR